jgi:hypothetical protein
MAFGTDVPGPQADTHIKGMRRVVRYRGFLLIPQADLTWLARPVRSPMRALPFRTPPVSLEDVKGLVDWRLRQVERFKPQAG